MGHPVYLDYLQYLQNIYNIYYIYILASVLSKKSVSFAEPPAPSKAGGGGKPNPLVKLVRGMWASRWVT